MSPRLCLLSPQPGEQTLSNKRAYALQLYFIILIYTYALHLRHGTYRTLPLSRSTRGLSSPGYFPDSESEDEDTHLHDVDDFHQPYHPPPRVNGNGHRYSASASNEVVFDADVVKVNTPRASR